jgi:hypothetical protein
MRVVRSIACAIYMLVLSCGGSGGARDAGLPATDGSQASPDADLIRINLGDVRGIDTNLCSCRVLDPSGLDGGSPGVVCSDLPAGCSVCPVPSPLSSPCRDLGVRCFYDDHLAQCECTARDGGAAEWYCVFVLLP